MSRCDGPGFGRAFCCLRGFSGAAARGPRRRKKTRRFAGFLLISVERSDMILLLNSWGVRARDLYGYAESGGRLRRVARRAGAGENQPGGFGACRLRRQGRQRLADAARAAYAERRARLYGGLYGRGDPRRCGGAGRPHGFRRAGKRLFADQRQAACRRGNGDQRLRAGDPRGQAGAFPR